MTWVLLAIVVIVFVMDIEERYWRRRMVAALVEMVEARSRALAVKSAGDEAAPTAAASAAGPRRDAGEAEVGARRALRRQSIRREYPHLMARIDPKDVIL